MAQTKDLGPLFFHGYTYPTKEAPIWNRTSTQEVEPPYRLGNSRIVRLPLTRKALVFGLWRSQRVNEEQALLSALTGRTITQAGSVTHDTLFGAEDVATPDV